MFECPSVPCSRRLYLMRKSWQFIVSIDDECLYLRNCRFVFLLILELIKLLIIVMDAQHSAKIKSIEMFPFFRSAIV